MFQRVTDDAANDQVPVPFSIRTDDMPGSVGGIAFVECVRVSHLIVIPQLTLTQVGLAEFPAFIGVIQSGLEALKLLFFADVKEEFENRDA